MLVVPEVLGHRQRDMSHAESASRRLVHLSEHHHHVGQYAGSLHLAVEFLAFTAAFPDPAEDADALLVPDHVMDHFREQDGFAHSCAAE